QKDDSEPRAHRQVERSSQKTCPSASSTKRADDPHSCADAENQKSKSGQYHVHSLIIAGQNGAGLPALDRHAWATGPGRREVTTGTTAVVPPEPRMRLPRRLHRR